jgi:hypothetical protein
MDNQVLTTSELAMNVEELGPQWTQWSTDCEQTEQWLLHGESDWETVTNVYSDTSNTEPRWTFKTPKTTQQANSGPESFPLPDFTRVFTVDASLANPLPPTVTVRLSDGTLCGGQCQVYLTKRTGEQPNVILGMGSPREGRIRVPGLQIGSELIGITTDGGYFGSHTAAEPGSQTLTLDRSGWNPKVTAQLESHGTVMTVTVTITTTEEMSGLQALRMDVGGIYSQTITLTGESDVYTGSFVFDRRASAQEGYIWIRGMVAANHQTVETVTSYAIAGVPGSHEWGYLDLNSLEGTLNLLVRPGGIPADASVIVLPIRQLEPFVGQDQAMPRGSAGLARLSSRRPEASPLTLVGTGYYLGTTEGVTGAITATLTLYYDPQDPEVRPVIERATFSIYHYYDTATSKGTWKNLGGVIDRENHSVSAPINQFGTYALVRAFYAYLPVMMVGYQEYDVRAMYLPMIMKTTANRTWVSR